MIRLKAFLALVFLLATAAACEPEPKPIVYGEEACAYCRMSIVDQRYAAQLVSETGKTFSFDATECMINYKAEHTDPKWHLELVTDYTRPATLIPATKATVLRSEKLPSPMGMYLTTVDNPAKAEALQAKHGGNIYSYEELIENWQNLPSL